MKWLSAITKYQTSRSYPNRTYNKHANLVFSNMKYTMGVICCHHDDYRNNRTLSQPWVRLFLWHYEYDCHLRQAQLCAVSVGVRTGSTPKNSSHSVSQWHRCKCKISSKFIGLNVWQFSATIIATVLRLHLWSKLRIFRHEFDMKFLEKFEEQFQFGNWWQDGHSVTITT